MAFRLQKHIYYGMNSMFCICDILVRIREAQKHTDPTDAVPGTDPDSELSKLEINRTCRIFKMFSDT